MREGENLLEHVLDSPYQQELMKPCSAANTVIRYTKAGYLNYRSNKRQVICMREETLFHTLFQTKSLQNNSHARADERPSEARPSSLLPACTGAHTWTTSLHY